MSKSLLRIGSLLGIVLAVSVVAWTIQWERKKAMESIPIPFMEEGGIDLRGLLTTIGHKRSIEVVRVTFPAGTDSETLRQDKIYLVSVPDDPAVTNVPLDQAVTISGGGPVDYFGYRYLSADAATEKQHRDDSSFTARFPGQFFASAKARAGANGSMITSFEQRTGITMLPTNDATGVMLARNALYVVVVNEPQPVTITVRRPICGNSQVETGETCDDGNVIVGDGCDDHCRVESGWYCHEEPSGVQANATPEKPSFFNGLAAGFAGHRLTADLGGGSLNVSISGPPIEAKDGGIVNFNIRNTSAVDLTGVHFYISGPTFTAAFIDSLSDPKCWANDNGFNMSVHCGESTIGHPAEPFSIPAGQTITVPVGLKLINAAERTVQFDFYAYTQPPPASPDVTGPLDISFKNTPFEFSIQGPASPVERGQLATYIIAARNTHTIDTHYARFTVTAPNSFTFDPSHSDQHCHGTNEVECNLDIGGSIGLGFTIPAGQTLSLNVAFTTAQMTPCGDNIVKASLSSGITGNIQTTQATTQISCSTASSASSAAPPNPCGNGVIDPGEDCDDGNQTNGDGCSAYCRKEADISVAVTGPQVWDGNPTPNGIDRHWQYSITVGNNGPETLKFVELRGSSLPVPSLLSAATSESACERDSVTHELIIPLRCWFTGPFAPGWTKTFTVELETVDLNVSQPQPPSIDFTMEIGNFAGVGANPWEAKTLSDPVLANNTASALCGNGSLNGAEQCDNGTLNFPLHTLPLSSYPQPVCLADCTLYQNSSTGNSSANSSASSSAASGQGTTGGRSVCQTLCGDGLIAGAEQCDDGKACSDLTVCTADSDCAGKGDGLCQPRDSDGCSATCAVETGWACSGQPSVCNRT